MLLSLFLFFLKLGFVSMGGGYPMVSYILQEGEAALGLTAQEFADMTALELLASGPIAINSATYIGFIKGGVLGAAVATAGLCAPAFIITAILYAFLEKFKENRYVQVFLATIKVACGGVLLTAAATLAKNILLFEKEWISAFANPVQNIHWVGVFIVVLCTVAIKKYKVKPITMLFVSAGIGALLL